MLYAEIHLVCSGWLAGCPSREAKLNTLWTLGIFALNFGPVLVGFVLDAFGPKVTAIFGKSVAPYQFAYGSCGVIAIRIGSRNV